MKFVQLANVSGEPRTKMFCRYCDTITAAFTAGQIAREVNGERNPNTLGSPACSKCGFYHVRQTIKPALKVKISTLDLEQCVYCGQGASEERLEIDHLIPVVMNGSDELDNLVLACHRCNLTKRTQNLVPAFGRFKREIR